MKVVNQEGNLSITHHLNELVGWVDVRNQRMKYQQMLGFIAIHSSLRTGFKILKTSYISQLSMPTLLIYEGFKIFFYANEHEPKHVHVLKGGDFAKIELSSLHIVNNTMKPKDIKKALLIVKDHQQEFERRWDEYFN